MHPRGPRLVPTLSWCYDHKHARAIDGKKNGRRSGSILSVCIDRMGAGQQVRGEPGRLGGFQHAVDRQRYGAYSDELWRVSRQRPVPVFGAQFGRNQLLAHGKLADLLRLATDLSHPGHHLPNTPGPTFSASIRARNSSPSYLRALRPWFFIPATLSTPSTACKPTFRHRNKPGRRSCTAEGLTTPSSRECPLFAGFPWSTTWPCACSTGDWSTRRPISKCRTCSPATVDTWRSLRRGS